MRRIAPLTINAGLEEVTILASVKDAETSQPRRVAIRFSYTPGAGDRRECDGAPDRAVAPLDEYAQKVQRSQARGLVYPYELIPLLTGSDGRFVEYDFDESGELGPVDRPYGRNTAGLIVGMVTRPTPRYPEGMTRVAMFGDPTKALGTVAEAECARVVAALDLAEEAVGTGRVVRVVLRRHHFDGQRHREHGLGVPCAAPNHHLHPGRR